MKKILWLAMLFIGIGAANIVIGMDVETKKIRNLTQEFFNAIEDCNIESVLQLLEEGVSLEEFDSEGKTPLHAAVESGNAEVVEVLLRNNAKVDARDKEGSTPLHNLCSCGEGGQLELAKLLIRHKANIGALTKDGATALEIAVLMHGNPVGRVLLNGLPMGEDRTSQMRPNTIFTSEIWPNPQVWIPAILEDPFSDPFYGKSELVKILLMNIDTMFQVDSNAVSAARKRYYMAFLILQRRTKNIILEKKLVYPILFSVQELRDDAACILINDLQYRRFINPDSYLASDVIVSAAAQLILENYSSLFDSVYQRILESEKYLPNIYNVFRDYFDPVLRKDMLLPIVKKGLENRIIESRAMEVAG